MTDECDFCSEEVDDTASIYPSRDFVDLNLQIAYRDAWVACQTCAAFIRQYDRDQDSKAKDNLARRAIEKYRRKYGLRGAGSSELNAVLMIEVRALHDKFWEHRIGEPVPYSTKQLRG